MNEQELRALIGAYSREAGDAMQAMNTFDLVAAITPRVEARAQALGVAAPDADFVLRIANRWLSESALAGAVAAFEDDE